MIHKNILKIIVLILIVFTFTVNSIAQDKEEAKKEEKLPDFTLKNLKGDMIKIEDLLGEGPIYLDFWATWCVPCKKEMPELQKLHKKYKDDGFSVVTISNDVAKNEGQVKKYIKRKRYTFEVLLDQTKEVSNKLGVPQILPYGILVDSDGNIVKKHMGYSKGDEEKLEEEIKQLLDTQKEETKTESKEDSNE